MKTLKESILSRASHSREGFKAQRRNEIEKWLKKYNIKNYTINDDFTIDVSDNISFETQILKELPEYIQFGIVRGYFDCSFCHLESLRGVPKKVEGSFDCSFNSTQFTEEDVKKVCRVGRKIIV